MRAYAAHWIATLNESKPDATPVARPSLPALPRPAVASATRPASARPLALAH